MSKSKAKKQKGKLPKRGFPRFLWLAIPLVIAAIVAGVFLYPTGQPSPENNGEPKAAIVDQLYSMQPNPGFINGTVASKFTSIRVMRSPLTFVASCHPMATKL